MVLLNLVGFGSVGAKGLIQLIRRIRGRKVTKVEVIEEARETVLTLEEGELIRVESRVAKAYLNPTIRKDVYEVMKPLEKEGVTKFSSYVGSDKTPTVRVEKEEITYFKPDVDINAEIEPTEKEMLVTIDSLAFKENNKWRVFDGTSSFFVTILDDEFLERVRSNRVRFAHDDVLHVRLRTTQMLDSDGLRAHHEIVKVIAHNPSQQLPLGLTDHWESGSEQ